MQEQKPATLPQDPSSCCCDANGNTLNTSNNGALGNGNNPLARRIPGAFSPRERLEQFNADFDMLKPLLMYNLENIQTFRAD